MMMMMMMMMMDVAQSFEKYNSTPIHSIPMYVSIISTYLYSTSIYVFIYLYIYLTISFLSIYLSICRSISVYHIYLSYLPIIPSYLSISIDLDLSI